MASFNVELQLRQLGNQGVVRGKKRSTTLRNPKQKRSLDLARRQYSVRRPNKLLVVDFSSHTTWSGFDYMALVVNVFSKNIVG